MATAPKQLDIADAERLGDGKDLKSVKEKESVASDNDAIPSWINGLLEKSGMEEDIQFSSLLSSKKICTLRL